MGPSPLASRILAFAVAALLGGCLSPTLPLPPPEPPDQISPQAATPGMWTIEGTCTAGALVTVFDEKTGVGVIVEDRDGDGRYQVELEASACDLAWVAQQVDTEESSRTSFVIQELTPSGPKDPNACK